MQHVSCGEKREVCIYFLTLIYLKFIFFKYVDNNFFFSYKFLIPINVQDGTGTISLTLFDKDANKMLEANVDDLVKVVIEV